MSSSDDLSGSALPGAQAAWRGMKLDIVDELVAWSGKTGWILRRHTYGRMRLAEGARPADLSEDDGLDVLLWREHLGVYLIDDIDDIRLRIIPAGRPEDTFGIVTGSLDVLRGTAVILDARQPHR